MKHIALTLVFSAMFGFAADTASAACYADYKAKQDNPLRLHYGVIELQGPCRPAPARREVADRLGASGWTLLNIVSVFGPEGLAERRANAGQFFLRF
ncbi:MAG: hypothetical protein AB3N13_05870 [Arenibacterium sp.]